MTPERIADIRCRVITFDATLWKEAARHFRHGRTLSRELEVRLKQLVWNEHHKRVTLVNAMSELLPRLAIYGEWCRACDSRVSDGHRANCNYVRALAAVHEAATASRR